MRVKGTLLSKFGIENSDDLTLTVSKERFEEYISPLLKNETNARLTTRPKEGDLIYFPLGDRLFEIKFVEHETPFYQLQKTYVYTLKCELFRPQDEVLDTNIEEIDNNLVETGYIQTLFCSASVLLPLLRQHSPTVVSEISLFLTVVMDIRAPQLSPSARRQELQRVLLQSQLIGLDWAPLVRLIESN